MDLGLVTHEDPAQLGRRHLVGQVGGHKGAGVDAHIHRQPIEVEAIERLIQRSQGADLVDSAQGTAPAQGEPDAGLARRRGGRHQDAACSESAREEVLPGLR